MAIDNASTITGLKHPPTHPVARPLGHGHRQCINLRGAKAPAYRIVPDNLSNGLVLTLHELHDILWIDCLIFILRNFLRWWVVLDLFQASCLSPFGQPAAVQIVPDNLSNGLVLILHELHDVWNLRFWNLYYKDIDKMVGRAGFEPATN